MTPLGACCFVCVFCSQERTKLLHALYCRVPCAEFLIGMFTIVMSEELEEDDEEMDTWLNVNDPPKASAPSADRLSISAVGNSGMGAGLGAVPLVAVTAV
jgi:hypothetical protein